MPVCTKPDVAIRLSELLSQWKIGEGTESQAVEVIGLLKKALQSSKLEFRHCFIEMIEYKSKQKDMFRRFGLIKHGSDLYEKIKSYYEFHMKRNDGIVDENWVYED